MTANAEHRDFLCRLFRTAIDIADPMRVIPSQLPPKPEGRVVVVGAGKASARMAEAVESVWGPCEGIVITRYGYARPCEGIRIVEAAHPVPDQAGADATQEILDLLETLGEDDFVLALISGGASALLSAPAGRITLTEKQQINAALLASGASIDQMNVLRKHISRVKGGQLAAATYPARMLALMISDVPGDDPAMIGSGPTVPDDSSSVEAMAILERWRLPRIPSVIDVLEQATGVVPEGDGRLAHVTNAVIAAPSQSLEAAADMARAAGLDVRMLGDDIEGEAREVAVIQADLAISIADQMTAQSKPVLLLSGGELTVTRRGDGIGGPNSEFALALAQRLGGHPGIFALAGDTDGVDGAAEVAGAVVTPDTLARSETTARDSLARNDSHSFFDAIGDQVITGPTLTNVNDFRAILVLPPA